MEFILSLIVLKLKVETFSLEFNVKITQITLSNFNECFCKPINNILKLFHNYNTNHWNLRCQSLQFSRTKCQKTYLEQWLFSPMIVLWYGFLHQPIYLLFIFILIINTKWALYPCAKGFEVSNPKVTICYL